VKKVSINFEKRPPLFKNFSPELCLMVVNINKSFYLVNIDLPNLETSKSIFQEFCSRVFDNINLTILGREAKTDVNLLKEKYGLEEKIVLRNYLDINEMYKNLEVSNKSSLEFLCFELIGIHNKCLNKAKEFARYSRFQTGKLDR